MTITKYDGVAILPKRCDRCNRLFWLEPYNIFHKLVGIEEYPLKQIECKDCICKAESEPKTGRCKDCKYFEYDSVAKVDGIPLIIAHEICNRWGDGCKTREDGYCFLFEPQEDISSGNITKSLQYVAKIVN